MRDVAMPALGRATGCDVVPQGAIALRRSAGVAPDVLVECLTADVGKPAALC